MPAGVTEDPLAVAGEVLGNPERFGETIYGLM